MMCARELLCEFAKYETKGQRFGSKSPPEIDFVAKAIVEVVPELAREYSSWWTASRLNLETAYRTATEVAFWPQVSAHLGAASTFMIATHDRNLDKDCTGIEVLEKAPCTTDKVESSFAMYDYCLHLRASFQATAGVAASMFTGAMSSRPEADARARRKAKANRKRTGESIEAEEEFVNDQLATWDATSFTQIPKAMCARILTSIRSQFKAICINPQKVMLEKHDMAKLERQRKTQTEEAEKHANRVRKFTESVSIDVITSVPALIALGTVFSGNPAGHVKALCDQIRVRVNVYGQKRGLLPPIGGPKDSTPLLEIARLEAALRDVVEQKLPHKPSAPLPPVRNAHAAPSVLAAELDKSRLRALSAVWKELSAMMIDLVFKASRKAVEKSRESRAVRRRGKGNKRAAVTPQQPSVYERSLRGVEFDDDGIDWRVLYVGWSDDVDEVAVWYYDIKKAAALGLSEDDMLTAMDNGDKCDALELSSIAEIRKWAGV